MADLQQEAVFFFWHEMALYVGPVVESDPHAHFCVELTLSLDGELDANLSSGAGEAGLGGVLVGSNVPHRHRLRGSRMAQLIVGPLTPAGMGLRASLGRRSVGTLPPSRVEPLCRSLSRLVECPDRDDAYATARSVIGQFGARSPVRRPDRRVLSTMNRLLENFAVNAPVRELAREAGLSESRFSHVFRRDVGVPLRTYRRWLRLRAGVVLGMSGWDLKDAAHEAGFADQADFSRACREAFGVSPSTITQRPTAVVLGDAPAGCSLMSSLAAGPIA